MTLLENCLGTSDQSSMDIDATPVMIEVTMDNGALPPPLSLDADK